MTSGGAQVIVVGAGVGGLGTALALSRAGHRVTLLERDATPLPADPDAAFEWDRRGAPQVRHSHALLARLRNLLRDRYPDVLADLLEAGATELRFPETMPVDITDREPRPGDEDLVALACRRTTFEWVLRRAVLGDAGVTLLDGVAVEGLLADREPGGVPRVTGVRVRHTTSGRDGEGNGVGNRVEDLAADVVVGSVGRRSAVPRWLAEVGVEPEVTEEDTGIIYLSRFYRLLPTAEMPDTDGPIGGDLGYLKYAVFQGDNRTFSVTFAVATDDDTLRARLLDPDGFGRAAATLPTTAAWVEADRSAPITPVHVMGGLVNRRTEFLDHEGAPLVLGFHAVGDAHTCTNPLYGRGCSLAMVQATLLADALAAHPGPTAAEATARSVAFEEASEREIRPWHRASVNQDRLNREHDASSGDRDPDAAVDPDTFVRDLMRDGLMPAVRTDPTVFRAFVRAFNLLDPPETLMADQDVIARVMTSYGERDQRPPEPSLGPPRADLMAVLAPA